MMVRFSSLSLASSRPPDPHLVRHLSDSVSFDFPENVAMAGLLAYAESTWPAYAACRLYSKKTVNPNDETIGLIVVYFGATVDYDLWHWYRPDPKVPLKKCVQLHTSTIRLKASERWAPLLGKPAGIGDGGVLEIEDSGDFQLMHGDDEYLWLRGTGWVENLVKIYEVGMIRRVVDRRRQVGFASIQPNKADIKESSTQVSTPRQGGSTQSDRSRDLADRCPRSTHRR
jgi:hypothetical protein